MRRMIPVGAAVILSACTANTTALTGPAVGDPSMLTLASGETKVVAGTALTLTFERVVGDSRCPVDVTCLWAGNAEVELRTSLAGVPSGSYRLSSFLEPHSFDVGAYRITLLEVAPQPREGVPIETADYRVKLRVDGL